MISNLVQFPIKQFVPAQRVSKGVMEYLYIIEYDMGGVACHAQVWATDSLNAKFHLSAIAFSGRVLYPLKDMVEEQERPKVLESPPPLPAIDPDMPSPDPNKPRVA